MIASKPASLRRLMILVLTPALLIVGLSFATTSAVAQEEFAVCLDGSLVGTACVGVDDVVGCENATCVIDDGPLPEICPAGTLEIDLLCAVVTPASQTDPDCPDGSRGEVDDCHIFVAKGPVPLGGDMAQCPIGSTEDGAGMCRKAVANARGYFFCPGADPWPELVGDLCHEYVDRIPTLCIGAAVAVQGRCLRSDAVAITTDCRGSESTIWGQCLDPIDFYTVDDCLDGTSLIQGACAIEFDGGSVTPCAYDSQVWGFGGDAGDGGCTYRVDFEQVECDPAYSLDDSLGGVCARYEAAVEGPVGVFRCADPEASLNGASCVYTAEFTVAVCPEPYERHPDGFAICQVILPYLFIYGCGPFLEGPNRPNSPAPSCWEPIGPQPGACLGLELDGSCLQIVGPFATACSEPGPCFQSFVSVDRAPQDQWYDVTCDAAIDDDDVINTLKFITEDIDPHLGDCADIPAAEPFRIAAGDVTNDHRISVLDALSMAQCAQSIEFC